MVNETPAPRVWNKRDRHVPKDAVYVGRPSQWGNPYTHEPAVYEKHKHDELPLILVPTREEAVRRFRLDVEERPYLVRALKGALKGKDLVCWCAPKACHADVLFEIANQEPK